MPNCSGWMCPAACTIPASAKEHIEQGRHFLQMDGKEVFRHAVTRMPESVRAVLARSARPREDLTLLLPHQANLRISEMVQRELELRDDQVYNNIQRYGNTTAATIPILLDECVACRPAQGGRPPRHDRLRRGVFLGKRRLPVVRVPGGPVPA